MKTTAKHDSIKKMTRSILIFLGVLAMIAFLMIFLLPKRRIKVREIDAMPMVFIPAGRFIMGTDQGSMDQQPAHTVNLAGYWIDQHEVTNGQYTRCVTAGVCSDPWAFDSQTHVHYYDNLDFADHPVLSVKWNQAQAYCGWVNGVLPTEAEWEKAARGTDARRYPWGNQEPDCSLVNFNYRSGDTTPIGAHPMGASPYGLLDTAGNVWEWTADWYDADYYANSPRRNPTGAETGTYRVIRGGNWYTGAETIESTFRFFSDPGSGWNSIGFRCVVK